MFRTTVVFFIMAASVQADDQCVRFLQPGILEKCCSAPLPGKLSDDFTRNMDKECMSLPDDGCERGMCIAKKIDFTTTDGKLDMSLIKERLEKSNHKLPADFIKKCIDGDLSKFGPPDVCDATKLMTCMRLQLVKTCPEWSNEGQCEGLPALNTECKTKYD